MLPEESALARTGRDPRLSDRERDRTIALLRLHCTEGRLTLDEFADRVGDVYAANLASELDAVVADLPVPWQQAPELREPGGSHGDAPRPRGTVRWLVAVFGSSARRGRYRLEDESAVFACFGDCTLDLSQALIDDPSPVVNAVALFGNVTVVVPEGIDVEMDGLAVFGEKRCETAGDTVPGSPVIRVRALAVFGEVRVRPASERDRRGALRFRRR